MWRCAAGVAASSTRTDAADAGGAAGGVQPVRLRAVPARTRARPPAQRPRRPHGPATGPSAPRPPHTPPFGSHDAPRAEKPEGRDRGGLKLAAALERFGLATAVRGARAVDVGASTGGFTQVLLDHGATSVLAVDAGRDQLRDHLRRDARVRVREGTDWKLLPLSEEPGPFDFFTVDVSFVAARNMLRSLAFRLRPGAEGVVLLKPQFELPDRLVRGGDVSDPTLRQRAADALLGRAERLGFRLVAQADSPVAGGSGTVEILTHLRFDGRGESLPQPGEQRPKGVGGARPKGKRDPAAPLAGGALSWFAVVAPGAEEVAAAETRALPACAGVTSVRGGVEFRGPLEAGMAASLHLRIPTRLLLRLGEVRAREFGKLRHQLAHLPWEAFLATGAAVRTTVSTTRCRLYHTGAIDEALRAAIGDRLGTAPTKAPTTDDAAPLVLLRGDGDVFTASIDSSGSRLHRRGWRLESGEAPLRESLAASLLALAGWRPDEALLDPMCGAGTLPIEAAAIALGRAPGADRHFAFETWPGLTGEARTRWAELGLAARASEPTTAGMAPSPPMIVGSDRDAAVVELARRNAERAHVAAHVQLVHRPLSDLQPPAETGLLVTNPPYGRRLGRRGDLPALYRELGGVLRHRLPGWRAAVVLPDPSLASAFRLPITSTHVLSHGGLRVTLVCLRPNQT